MRIFAIWAVTADLGAGDGADQKKRASTHLEVIQLLFF